jgi:hypothetical protein
MTRPIATLLALSLFQLQAASDWSRVRALPQGTALEVVREDSQTFRGSLTSVTENQVVIRSEQGPQTLGRSTIRAVKAKTPGRKTRNALIGAAIAGGGVAVGMSFICASCWGETDNWGSTVAIFTAIAAGGGALIGWMLPGYKTIYKAPKSPRQPVRK